MAPQPPPPIPSVIYQFAAAYNTYILPNLPDAAQSLSNTISPLLSSITLAASNGDIVSIAAFLLTVYLSLKIADYIRRSVIGWVIFLIKIVVMLALVQAAFYVNQYGVQKALGDAEWIVGLLWGLVEGTVTGSTAGTDNQTRGYGNGLGSAYGGRQQAQAGRGQTKGKGGFGWT